MRQLAADVIAFDHASVVVSGTSWPHRVSVGLNGLDANAPCARRAALRDGELHELARARDNTYP
jgi:hypothetical protein